MLFFVYAMPVIWPLLLMPYASLQGRPECRAGHDSVLPGEAEEVAQRVVRCSHHFAGFIHALRAVPPVDAVRRSQSSQVDHHTIAVKKRMIAAVSSNRGAHHLPVSFRPYATAEPPPRSPMSVNHAVDRQESTIGFGSILGVAGDLSGGVDAVADAAGAAESAETRSVGRCCTETQRWCCSGRPTAPATSPLKLTPWATLKSSPESTPRSVTV